MDNTDKTTAKEEKTTQSSSSTPQEKKALFRRKPREKKLPKQILAKKLPRPLKRRYTQKALKKRFLNRLYIPKDREFLQSFFQPIEGDKKNRLAIDRQRLLPKADFLKLKSLVKEIKKQKARVRWIPLGICLAAATALISMVVLFKDPLIKWGIRSAMQSIFKARCDIESVHLGILDMEFTITGLKQTNMNNTMTNLFEIGKLSLDFDLKELLRKRFAADNLEVSGVLVNTKRETDGALPQKKTKKKSTSNGLSFQEQLSQFTTLKMAEAQTGIVEIFQQYNPQTILEDFYSQMSSPKVIQESEKEITALIPQWEKIPEEMKLSIDKLIADGQAAAEFNWKEVESNPASIQEGIKLIATTIKSTDSMIRQTDQTIKKLKEDALVVQGLMNDAKNAIEKDFQLVSVEINKIGAFKLDKDQKFLSSIFNVVISDTVRKYYPIVKDLVREVRLFAAKQSEKPEVVVEEEEPPRRFAGQNIVYTADRNPVFLIERIHGSGASDLFSLELTMTDISSNMDKWGKPAALKGKVVHGGQEDAFSGQLDLRKNRKGNIFDVHYDGKGYPVTLAVPEADVTPGVPKAVGKAAFGADFGFDLDGSFNIGGAFRLNPVTFTATAFEPAFAYDLYSRALAKFTSVDAQVEFGFSPEQQLFLDIETDLDEQFVRVLTELVNEELQNLKALAKKKVQEALATHTASLEKKFGDFNALKTRIESESAKLKNFKSQLEKKEKEGAFNLESIGDRAKETAEKAAREAALKAIEEAREKSSTSSTSNLKSLFNLRKNN